MRTRHNVLQIIVSQRFFESIDKYAIEEKYYVEPTRSMLSSDWGYKGSGVWAYHEPPGATMPAQGWKIHVSAMTNSAPETLERCVPVLARHRVTFKHASDRLILSFMNNKSWNRGGSGKFITVYPRDDEQFLALLEDLDQATRGLKGPYILSDRRYRDSGVVFYRYGTLQPQSMLTPNGTRQPFLLAPNGDRIPEVRGPMYAVPPWTTDIVTPNAPPSAPTGDVLIKDGRYKVNQALGYTNSGGVYFARDTVTGDAVVIKEARPFTNWLSQTDDATQLLAKEHRLLATVADTGISPKPIELFQEWEHSYLVQEFVTGLSMERLMAQRAILLRTRYDADDVRKYRALLGNVFSSLVAAVETLHSRNIIFGDLSPTNVLWIEEEQRVRLIDYESAYEIGRDLPTRLSTAGFVAPWSMTVKHDMLSRFENDWYAVGALMLSLVLPVSEFLGFAPNGAEELVKSLTREAHLPAEYGDIIMKLLSRNPPSAESIIAVLDRTAAYDEPLVRERGRVAEAGELDALARDIASAIVANATPERADRLFPADFRLIGTNPSGFAYGAAGVLYALARSGHAPPEPLVEWLLRRTLSPRDYPPGLNVGLAGIAWSMLELGRIDEARAVMASAAGHPLLNEAYDLAFGLAGWGLANLKFFLTLHDEAYLHEARRSGRELLARATLTADGYSSWPESGDTHFGLEHGASGIALFLLYLALLDDDANVYDAAVRALTYDLTRGIASEDGGMSWGFAESMRGIVLPYWSYGSAGIGAVALRFKTLGHHTGLDDYLEKIFIDTDRRHAVWPGLRMGLAGLGSFHVDTWALTGSERAHEAAHNVLRGVLTYGIRDESGLSFIGHYQARLSYDYSTGSAGVLRFVTRLRDREPSDLFLDHHFPLPEPPGVNGTLRTHAL